jgi:hypothetical protein
MRRFSLLCAVALVLALLVAAPSSSNAVSPAQLTAAGWTCFPVPELGIHCSSPGQGWPPTGPSAQLLYFSDSTGAFLGTETLIRADVFNGQPCPGQGGEWIDLVADLGYYGCHRR